jgi:hypothetical protein
MTAIHGNRLSGTDGFLVESADGKVGWVEEVWLGEDGRPRALAVQTVDGRHALLLEEDVEAVEREQHWVVVEPNQQLLELGAPRVRTSNGRIVATWMTTGKALTAPTEAEWHLPHLPHRTRRVHPRLAAAGRRISGWPFWLSLAVLAGSLVAILSFMMVLAFLIAKLITGAAY